MVKLRIWLRSLFLKGITFWKSWFYSLEQYLRSKVKASPIPTPKGRRIVVDTILSRRGFQETLLRVAKDPPLSKEEILGTARSYLREIAADQNYLLFPFWEGLISWALDKICEGVVVDQKKLDRFQAEAGSRPVVFVPNHRSHMDGVILNYLFYQNRVPMPLVCGGINMSFWPFGPLARRSGVFFIRRSYEGNDLYAACVQAYIEELLRDKCFLEFFIEGTRSRSGKLLPPRMGILSAIVESHLKGVADILLVPTSVTYDSVLEEKSYLHEHAGGAKRSERASDLLRLLKYLKRRSGKVYLKFGEPVSLKEWPIPKGPEEKRKSVEKLAYELTYRINRSFVVTPTSLVAATILSHPGKLIRMEEILTGTEPLIDYLQYKDCEFSLPLRRVRRAALEEATLNFRDQGLIREIRDDEETYYLILDEKRAALDYHKNGSLHFLVSLATLSHLLIREPTGVLPLDRIRDEFLFFKSLFRHEFTFSQRQPLEQHIEKLTRYLEQKGYALLQDRRIRLKPGGEKSIRPFATLLKNYLEGYAVLWNSMKRWGNRRWEEKDLISQLIQKGRLAHLKGQIVQTEGVSRFIFTNALSSFNTLEIVMKDVQGVGKRKKTYFYRNREIPHDLEKKLNDYLGWS